MVNEGSAKVTRLCRAQDKNLNISPTTEPAPTQAAAITLDDAKRIERAIIVAAINHKKVYQ